MSRSSDTTDWKYRPSCSGDRVQIASIGPGANCRSRLRAVSESATPTMLSGDGPTWLAGSAAAVATDSAARAQACASASGSTERPPTASGE